LSPQPTTTDAANAASRPRDIFVKRMDPPPPSTSLDSRRVFTAGAWTSTAIAATTSFQVKPPAPEFREAASFDLARTRRAARSDHAQSLPVDAVLRGPGPGVLRPATGVARRPVSFAGTHPRSFPMCTRRSFVRGLLGTGGSSRVSARLPRGQTGAGLPLHAPWLD
jgi:hypothetical protein